MNYLPRFTTKSKGIDKTYCLLDSKGNTRNMLKKNINKNFAKSLLYLYFEKGNKGARNVLR